MEENKNNMPENKGQGNNGGFLDELRDLAEKLKALKPILTSKTFIISATAVVAAVGIAIGVGVAAGSNNNDGNDYIYNYEANKFTFTIPETTEPSSVECDYGTIPGYYSNSVTYPFVVFKTDILWLPKRKKIPAHPRHRPKTNPRSPATKRPATSSPARTKTAGATPPATPPATTVAMTPAMTIPAKMNPLSTMTTKTALRVGG